MNKKLQWVNCKDEMPKGSGVKFVIAQINIGSPHECMDYIFVKSEPELKCKWVDLQGEPIGDEVNVIQWCKII